MVITYSVGIPLVLALALGSGFLANEWSHGGLSEAMGMGHNHMLDFGDYHCADHNDPQQGAMHMAHMHQADAPMPHDGCPGGSDMHNGMGDMMATDPNRMDGTGMDGTGMMP